MDTQTIQAESCLVHLDFPRENGSEGLEHARTVLDSLLQAVALEPQTLLFSCSAYRSEAAALFVVLAAVLLIAGAWRNQRKRGVLAFSLAFVLALAIGSGLFDPLLPSTPQASLHVVVEPQRTAVREVLLGAHYDSKTEPLDHVERSFLYALATLASLLATFLVLRGARARRAAALVAAVTLFAVGGQLAAGRLIRHRSHGAVDDAAACALLVEFAARASHRPLLETRLRFVWWSGEEVGAQGSESFVANEYSSLPRLVVNLEGIGAGARLAYAGLEWTTRGPARTTASLIRALEAASGTAALHRLPYPIFTDAGPFLRRGIAAITLLNIPGDAMFIRHLHGAEDRLERVDTEGMSATRRVLLRLLLALDESATTISRARNAHVEFQ